MTTKVVSLNPTDFKVYLIQHYVIKFVSDLRQIGCFLTVLLFPPPINQSQQPVVGGQTDPQTFPVRTLKIFGSIQIGCGILLGILSSIGVALDAIAMNAYCSENIVL
jgi:hypothetical protein